MTEQKKILCVVPARGGSKGIPKKNLALIQGESLTALTAGFLTQMGLHSRNIISTDDEQIAEEARIHGLDVPFIRPAELASDQASSIDTWIHAWETSEEIYSETYDISILLEPTSPMRTRCDVTKALAKIEAGYPSALTVSRVPAHYTPEKSLISNQGRVEYYIGEKGRLFNNRHRIPEYYHRNGACYAVTRQQLQEKREIVSGAALVQSDGIRINIDDPLDLELTRYLMGRQI